MTMMTKAMIVKIRNVITQAMNLGKVTRIIKLSKVNAVTMGNNTLTHTTKALFKVAYHQGEEVILGIVIKLVALTSFFYFYVF
jgi:hypothetical protein